MNEEEETVENIVGIILDLVLLAEEVGHMIDIIVRETIEIIEEEAQAFIGTMNLGIVTNKVGNMNQGCLLLTVINMTGVTIGGGIMIQGKGIQVIPDLQVILLTKRIDEAVSELNIGGGTLNLHHQCSKLQGKILERDPLYL